MEHPRWIPFLAPFGLHFTHSASHIGGTRRGILICSRINRKARLSDVPIESEFDSAVRYVIIARFKDSDSEIPIEWLSIYLQVSTPLLELIFNIFFGNFRKINIHAWGCASPWKKSIKVGATSNVCQKHFFRTGLVSWKNSIQSVFSWHPMWQVHVVIFYRVVE